MDLNNLNPLGNIDHWEDDLIKRYPENKNEKSQQGQETPFKLSNKYTSSNKDDKKFKPIKDYKPLGNLIYNEELLTKLENRLS